jgi:hypothetical protein
MLQGGSALAIPDSERPQAHTCITPLKSRLKTNILPVLYLEIPKVNYLTKASSPGNLLLHPKPVGVMTYRPVTAGGETRGLVGGVKYLLCSVLPSFLCHCSHTGLAAHACTIQWVLSSLCPWVKQPAGERFPPTATQRWMSSRRGA